MPLVRHRIPVIVSSPVIGIALRMAPVIMRFALSCQAVLQVFREGTNDDALILGLPVEIQTEAIAWVTVAVTADVHVQWHQLTFVFRTIGVFQLVGLGRFADWTNLDAQASFFSSQCVPPSFQATQLGGYVCVCKKFQYFVGK